MIPSIYISLHFNSLIILMLKMLLNHRFSNILVGFLKPHPETYRVACERLGIAPGECLYVGDGGDNELTGAAAAGLHAVLIETVARTDLARLTLNHEGATWAGPRIEELSQVAGLLAT